MEGMETLPSTVCYSLSPGGEDTRPAGPTGKHGTGRRQQEQGESLGDALITEVGELGGGAPRGAGREAGAGCMGSYNVSSALAKTQGRYDVNNFGC